ncbi:MAG: fibronectin type III domain-containing protein [Spirochaetes bacterium]|nr:fibronectin type III domain-containing protein [Spirochaetota bacterium]
MSDTVTTIRSRLRALAPAILCAAAAILAACYDDGMEELMELENYYSRTPPLAVPEGYPVPGNGGVITVADVTPTSVRLEWQRATDDATPQGYLKYRVYYATEPISTAAAAMKAGTPFNGWTADLTGIDVTGLYGGSNASVIVVSTTYYFNVLVSDGDMHISNYIMVAVTPSTATRYVYLFAEGTARRGNLSTTSDARGDIDSLCRSSETFKALGTGNVRGFISVSSDDSIGTMPVNFGVPQSWTVRSPGGRIIASSWSALFDDLSYTLEALNVVDDFWWSGSLADGSYDAAGNCSGWADGTGGSDGAVGAHHRTTMQWLHWGRHNCNTERHVLCLSW